MPVSFRSFVALQFQANPLYRKLCASALAFYPYYLKSYGFGAWLETLRGHHCSWPFTRRLALTFINDGDRTPDDIPALLGLLERDYDVSFPIKEGIYHVDFWRNLVRETAH